MITETFNGCAIRVRVGKKEAFGQMFATVNGEPYPTVEKFDETNAVSEIERDLALIHAEPIDGDRWPASFYAPGTYELCDEGLHPREIGGKCKHITCQPCYWASRTTGSYAAGDEA